ncbi:RNA polymerase sigma factor [Acetivibrio mesophilus]|uniref:Sigma-70 family RNA polymerase sigma factor n=1 Tax=Acetivibrio mesophilus TaxID=2487273 RepID=A0A4Q0I0F2_9FIRM|nr:sigma-70 family RNA polymerase sigma factor [Acetivibrio mesophilus]ODM26597.1 RNA polymerase subunit sigma-24 [Clostridium sp. Bc-iso-3]RXE57684.1 sigma-70 family RNA polymerase sigma factor [Acetivibrio mesophilus]HHV28920.1 sigma-70 family RNA polymerase sigma factor [Clostridium sp.]
MLKEDTFKKAQDGDLKSVEEICSSTWEAVYRFIYYKVQNRQEAEDITQETYVKALSHLQKNSVKIEQYTGFLKTVALNILRDKWRKKKRRGTNVNIEAIDAEKTAIEDETEASAQRELIRNALDRLNEEQRMVVELRILKGYSVAETARIIKKKESTVRVLQYRALQTLASILKNND